MREREGPEGLEGNEGSRLCLHTVLLFLLCIQHCEEIEGNEAILRNMSL